MISRHVDRLLSICCSFWRVSANSQIACVYFGLNELIFLVSFLEIGSAVLKRQQFVPDKIKKKIV
jgi:hypothetical protein